MGLIAASRCVSGMEEYVELALNGGMKYLRTFLIRSLLKLRGNRLQPCAPVRRRLQEKLVDVRRRLADLQKLEHELRLALRSCNKELRKRSAHCPILRRTNTRKPESVQ
jgi:hypothetical protein